MSREIDKFSFSPSSLIAAPALENDVPPFQGKDGEECETFIVSVANKMFTEGKQDDDTYIAQFAATKLTGKALRWFSTLDQDTTDSWRRLRSALLTRYPASSDEESPL